MKKDLFIFATLLLFTIVILVFTIGQSTIDIQLHDTYIILDKLSLAILILGPLTFLFFLARGLRRRFSTASTNMGLIIGLILTSYIIFRLALIQISFRNQIRDNFEFSALPGTAKDREEFVNKTNNKIALTWELFGIFIVGIGWTGYRTYKLTTKEK